MFNKGLITGEKQERLLKRLKNTEDKTDGLRAIEGKDDQSRMKSIGFDFKKSLSPEGVEAYNEIVNKEKKLDYIYLGMKASRKNRYNFKCLKF